LVDGCEGERISKDSPVRVRQRQQRLKAKETRRDYGGFITRLRLAFTRRE